MAKTSIAIYKKIDQLTRRQQEAFDAYTTIVVNRQKNPLPENEYGEIHHVIPKSCGGPLKAKWNLVKLTPEEHYIAHYLLTFIYAVGEEHESMMYAWNQVNGRIKGDFISAEEYGRLKREFSILQGKRASSMLKGRKRSAETKRKISEALKGRTTWNKGIPRTEEVKMKLSEARKGTHLSDDAKRKVSEFNKGKKVSDETRRKISEALTGKAKSEEHKRRLSESKRGKTHKGHPSWNRGKTGVFSDETRRKMSEARKAYWAKRRKSINGIKG